MYRDIGVTLGGLRGEMDVKIRAVGLLMAGPKV